MELYFRDGADLTDREVLVQAAREAGLDPEEVRKDLASERDVAEVEAEAARANQAGISGVPFFIFGNKLGVSGAQSPEVLAEAIDKARETAPA